MKWDTITINIAKRTVAVRHDLHARRLTYLAYEKPEFTDILDKGEKQYAWRDLHLAELDKTDKARFDSLRAENWRKANEKTLSPMRKGRKGLRGARAWLLKQASR